MDEKRYHEILPVAYLVAALAKGGKPKQIDIGQTARDIEDAEDPKCLACRIALASVFAVTIVSVELVTVDFGSGRSGEKFNIVFDPVAKDQKRQDMPTPLLSEKHLGSVAKKIWDRWNPDGTNHWVGKRMLLYKHNDPPREGDKSPAGFRCCVYAEPLDS